MSEKKVLVTQLVCDLTHPGKDKLAERLFIRDSSGTTFTLDVCEFHKRKLLGNGVSPKEPASPPPDDAQWLTAVQVRSMGIPKGTMDWSRKSGALKYKLVGPHKALYSRASVEAFLKERVS